MTSLRRTLLAALLVSGAACSNRASDSTPTTAADTSATTAAPAGGDATTTTAAPAGITFGDLPSPCGAAPEGVTPAVNADEAQGSTDTIRLAVPTDQGAPAAPGLNAELYDAALAFSKWCNEQGGISGLPIEVAAYDAKLFEVPAQIEAVCSGAFAMVGGGWAFDEQSFPRFHECGMIDIAGYTVSAAKGDSDNMVAPMPNPANVKSAGWYQWAMATHPDDMAAFGTVFGDFGVTKSVEQSYVEILDSLGAKVVVRVPHNPSGEATWTPIAQQLKNAGVKALTFSGVPEVAAQLMKAFDELDWRPNITLLDGGFYADVLISRAGSSAEGTVVRTSFAMLEEADKVKAVADYLDMMKTHNDGGKIAALGMQATSSYLLFASAAKACIEANGGALDRACVMAEAGEITSWTGGGLHAPTNPAGNQPSECFLLVEVKDGKFQRLYPAEFDSGATVGDTPVLDDMEVRNGFACSPKTVVTLTGDYGDVSAGKLP